MAAKRKSGSRLFSIFNRSSKKQEPVQIPEWIDYASTEDNLVPIIRSLTVHLVTQHHEGETEIAATVIDQLIEEYGTQPVTRADSRETVGIGLGAIADLGTVESFLYATTVMQEIASIATDSTKTIAEVLRELLVQRTAYERLLSRVQQEMGLDPKRARRYLDTTLDAIDPQFRFVLGEAVPMQEHRYCEFKEIKSETKQLNRILDRVERYTCAFLNRGGGRIYFGIDDKHQRVRGVLLTRHQQDELCKRIGGKMRQMTPPVSPDQYRVNFHEVVDDEGEEIPNLVVVEIIVPLALDRLETRTSGGTKYVRSDRGAEKISQ